MMNRAIRSLTGLLAVGVLSIGFAQNAAAQNLWTGGSYGVAQSLSDTKNFSDDFSFRNFDLEFRAYQGGVSIGGTIGWHVFHDKVIEATDLEGVPITAAGLQFRTVNTVPVLLTAHKYFGAVGDPRLYAGVGAGLAWTENNVDIGILSLANSEWGFAAMPEVGFIAPLSTFTEMYVSVKYQWTSGDIGARAAYFSIGFLSKPW